MLTSNDGYDLFFHTLLQKFLFLTVPNAPKNFSSSTLSENKIILNWLQPDGYAHEYEIVYTNGSTFTEHVNVSGSTFNETLTSLLSDCQYHMTIFTVNFNISSSNETSSNYTCQCLLAYYIFCLHSILFGKFLLRGIII